MGHAGTVSKSGALPADGRSADGNGSAACGNSARPAPGARPAPSARPARPAPPAPSARPARPAPGARLAGGAPLWLGLGFLFAAFIGVLNETGEPTRVFVGIFSGLLFAGVATCAVTPAVLRRARRGSLRPLLFALVGVSAVLALVGVATYRLEGVAGTLGGALFGAGSLVLATCWAVAYARFSLPTSMRRGAWSLFAGVTLYALLGALFGPGAAVPECALCAASAVCAAVSLSRGPFESDAPAPGGIGMGHRLWNLVKAAWAPLAGLMICAFLLGLLWYQPRPSTDLLGIPSVLIDAALPFAVTLAIAAVAGRLDDYGDVKRMVWVVVPIVAAMFLITPNFDSVTAPEWNALVRNLQNSGSCALIACAFSLLLMAARANDFAVPAVFGASGALVAGSALAGVLVYGGIQKDGNVIAVVLFVVYVCATIVILALFGAGDREVHEQEQGALETYLLPRCARLAAANGLTQRETEVLELLGRGHSYAFIAESMYISEATARTHARNIYHKLGVDGQEGLINLIDEQ